MVTDQTVSSADKSGGSATDDASQVSPEVFERFKNDLFKQKNQNNEIKKQLEDAQAKLDEFNRKEQEKAGNFDAVKKDLETQLAKEKEKSKQIKETFAEKTLFKTVKLTAQQKGCVDPDVLLKLLNAEELKSVMTDDFDIDDTKLGELIVSKQKEKPYLFESGVQAPKNLNPSKDKPTPNKSGYQAELDACKTQKEIDAVLRKYKLKN